MAKNGFAIATRSLSEEFQEVRFRPRSRDSPIRGQSSSLCYAASSRISHRGIPPRPLTPTPAKTLLSPAWSGPSSKDATTERMPPEGLLAGLGVEQEYSGNAGSEAIDLCEVGDDGRRPRTFREFSENDLILQKPSVQHTRFR